MCVCSRNNPEHYLVIKDKVLEGRLFSGLKSLFVGVSSDKGVSRIRFKDLDRTVIAVIARIIEVVIHIEVVTTQTFSH